MSDSNTSNQPFVPSVRITEELDDGEMYDAAQFKLNLRDVDFNGVLRASSPSLIEVCKELDNALTEAAHGASHNPLTEDEVQEMARLIEELSPSLMEVCKEFDKALTEAAREASHDPLTEDEVQQMERLIEELSRDTSTAAVPNQTQAVGAPSTTASDQTQTAVGLGDEASRMTASPADSERSRLVAERARARWALVTKLAEKLRLVPPSESVPGWITDLDVNAALVAWQNGRIDAGPTALTQAGRVLYNIFQTAKPHPEPPPNPTN